MERAGISPALLPADHHLELQLAGVAVIEVRHAEAP
jgi:hypothetical protein